MSDKDTDRLVTDDKDSIYLTRQDDDNFWLLVMDHRTHRCIELQLTTADCEAIVDLLNDK